MWLKTVHRQVLNYNILCKGFFRGMGKFTHSKEWVNCFANFIGTLKGYLGGLVAKRYKAIIVILACKYT